MYRPLSPHILIYKPQLSSALSVFHRITASILSLSILGICILMKCIACHVNYYPIYTFMCLLHVNYIWLLVTGLIIILLSFFYHISNGIRHLIWDFSESHRLDKTSIKLSSYLVLLSACACSGVILRLLF